MMQPYQFILPSLVTVFFLIGLSLYTWHRRTVPGALAFAVSALLASIWVGGLAMEYAAASLVEKIFWIKFQAVWQLPAVTSLTCFILEYTWPGRWLTRRNLALLSITPFLTLAAILTDNFYHLIWRGFVLDGKLMPALGPVGWFFIAYTYGLGLVQIAAFIWLFLRSPQHRWPVAIMVTGQVVVRAAYPLKVFHIVQTEIPLETLIIAFLFLMYAIVLFGFRIFDPVAAASQTLIEQMQDGMLVLDLNGRVSSLNPAASAILGTAGKNIKEHPIAEFLSEYAAEGNPAQAGAARIEVTRGTGAECRDYILTASALKDWRGLAIGRLLLLQDVTEQKRTQAKIVEQQRSLATLQERERLARELHDSLGQTLAATHIQASATRVFLARGDLAQTDQFLEQMADMTLAAETDIREYLLGVKAVSSANTSFFQSLRQYMEDFTRQYRLQVELNVPLPLEARGLGSAVEVQLLRIIQEALSNVRKHAQAEHIQLIFTGLESMVEVTILDDGGGFDTVAVRQGEGFGLQSMRERAETLNGSLDVISHPGDGTRVIARVPVTLSEKREETSR